LLKMILGRHGKSWNFFWVGSVGPCFLLTRGGSHGCFYLQTYIVLHAMLYRCLGCHSNGTCDIFYSFLNVDFFGFA